VQEGKENLSRESLGKKKRGGAGAMSVSPSGPLEGRATGGGKDYQVL